MEDKEKYKEFLKKHMNVLLFQLELLDKSISVEGLQNEQFVLDFYDNLNKISVRK